MKLKENFGRQTSNDDPRFYRNRNLSNSNPLPPIKEQNEQGDLEETLVRREINRKVKEQFLDKKKNAEYNMDACSISCGGVHASLVCSTENNMALISPSSNFIVSRNEPERLVFHRPILPPILDRKSIAISGMKKTIESRAISQNKKKTERKKSVSDFWGSDDNKTSNMSEERIRKKDLKINEKDLRIASSANGTEIPTTSLRNHMNDVKVFKNDATNTEIIKRKFANISTSTNNDSQIVNVSNIATIWNDCTESVEKSNYNSIISTMSYVPNMATIRKAPNIIKLSHDYPLDSGECYLNTTSISRECVPISKPRAPNSYASHIATKLKDNAMNLTTLSDDCPRELPSISGQDVPHTEIMLNKRYPNKATMPNLDVQTKSDEKVQLSKTRAPDTKETEKEETRPSYLWKSHGHGDTELSVTVYEDSSVKLSTTLFKDNSREDSVEHDLSFYKAWDSDDVLEFKTLAQFLHSANAQRRNGICMGMDQKVSATLLEFNRIRAITALFQF